MSSYRPGAFTEAILVAASDAPSRLKRLADPWVCDGTADQDTINLAIAASAITGSPTRYGTVILTAGRFSQTGAILIPGRGFTLRGQGFSTQLYAAVSAGSFSNTGEGSEEALIMLAETAAARNASNVTISDLYFNCSDGGSSISGIWLDSTSGGSTDSTSVATYGEPAVGINGYTKHTLTRLRMRGVDYGIGLVDGGGDNISDVRMNGVTTAGYYTSTANAGTNLDQCHAITASADNAVGFDLRGDFTSVTGGCKPAYFDRTGCVGYSIVGNYCNLDSSESQDNTTGLIVTGTDFRSTGLTVETEKYSGSPTGVAGVVGVDLQAATRASMTGLNIHPRNSGTYVNGLRLPSGGGGHRVDAYIWPGPTTSTPAGSITTAVRHGSPGSAVSVIGDIGSGMFNIEIVGGATLVTTS